MAVVHKSVLLAYSAEQMYALVENFEDYPKFLPWCGGSKVLAKTRDGKVARIDISFKGVAAHFTTENVNEPSSSMSSSPYAASTAVKSVTVNA